MLLWYVVLSTSLAFYLPGVAPNNFRTGDPVPLLVNSLTAEDSLIPFDFYHSEFNFCKPEEAVSQRESLGSILFGDRLFTSKFQLNALEKEMCKTLCVSSNTKENNAFIVDRFLVFNQG
jgi:transmembrane 9 superfamily protein 2/4